MGVGKISAIAAGPGPENAAIISANTPCIAITTGSDPCDTIVWNIEAGRKQPPEEVIHRIAALLGVPVDAISYTIELAEEAAA